ncbi:MAG: hypothetical protein CBD16_05040 [Betaproteobacteria bacterium TMED156]|nr:MAG: hypothetical protein CBD16_05040 [Betaproteobacteria bacterium TMED156]
MMETNRIKTLAGLVADNNEVAKEETSERELKDTGIPAETTAEASGKFADPIYDLCDELGCEAEHPVYSDLIRYLDGDTIKDFVDEYRRVHDFGNGVENPEEAVEVEAEAEEAVEAEAEAEEVLPEEDVEEGNEFAKARQDAIDAGKDEFEIDGKKYKVTGDKTKSEAVEEEVAVEEETDAETIEEAPTMDTTQLITLLKNAGLNEEQINKKLDEWANTPAGVGEVEPRVHGGEDNYEFAQAVNLSLKKYLKAKDMGVQIKEATHTVENMKAAYKAKKNESQK